MKIINDIIYDVIDEYTGQYHTYKKIARLETGELIDDTLCDGVIIRKYQGEYFQRNVDYLTPEMFGVKVYNKFYTKTVDGIASTGFSTKITEGYYEDEAMTIPVFDSTSRLQKCLDVAKNTTKKVLLPRGSMFIRQIGIPLIYCRGVGLGDFGRRNEGIGHNPSNEGNEDITVLMQLPGVDDDAITFRTFGSLGQQRITGLDFGNFILRGNNGNILGNGISQRLFGGDRNDINSYAGLNGTHNISNIMIREFPENGYFNWKGGVPGYLRHINSYYNGKYGIEWLGQSYGNGVVVFENCDGDANTGGAVVKIGSTQSGGVFNFYSTRGEMKPNPYYGPTQGFKYAQPHVIEVVDCYRDCAVNIYGAFGNKYTPDSVLGNDVTEAIILVNTTSEISTPTITFSGLSSITSEGQGFNNNYTLKDVRLNFNIPKGCRSGIYNLGSNHFDGIFNPVKPKWIVGQQSFSPANAVADAILHVIGSLPSIGASETDVADEISGFIFTQSGGGIQLRNLATNGSVTIYEIWNKNADGTLKSKKSQFGTNGFQQLESSNSAGLLLTITDGSVDEKNVRLIHTLTKTQIATLKDDGTGSFSFLDFFRSGITPKNMRPRVPLVLGNNFDSNSDTAIATLTVNSVNPDISKSNYFVTANTQNTSIVYFLNSVVGQFFIIKCNDDYTTLKHDAAGFGNGRLFLKSKRDTKLINGRTYFFTRGAIYSEELGSTTDGDFGTALLSGGAVTVPIAGLTNNAIVQVNVKTLVGNIAQLEYTANANSLEINAKNSSGALETTNNSTVVYRILSY